MCDIELEKSLQLIAHKLRIDSVKMTNVTASGHPTSCASIAEIMSILFFNEMKYFINEPLHPSNDRIILSKGHAAPILYAAWAEAGLFPKSDLLSLRLLGSNYEGHPTPRLNFIDVATGSLGQGLGVAAGMAYDAKYIKKSRYRVFCILGDGECMEGSVWEAAAFAGFYKLNNLVVIVDVNEFGQSNYTYQRYNMESHSKIWESFGFKTNIVDGHNVAALMIAFSEARSHTGGPFVILAKTLKGAYFSQIEGKPNWHGKTLGTESERVISHLEGLINNSNVTGKNLRTVAHQPSVDLTPIAQNHKISLTEAPKYEIGKDFSTRMAFGTALSKLDNSQLQIAVCDGDVCNSTYTDKFKNRYPDSFVQCFIAEQNMVSVAVGLTTRKSHVVFLSTFCAFWSRAHDQIRMAAISECQLKFVGTHSGTSIGEDGGSQMGLEDIAMFRCIPNSVVLYPSDAVSAERSIELAANTPNLVYVRMSRPSTCTVYKNDEIFEVGKLKVCKKSDKDKILVVTGGVTLIECLKAAETLSQSGTSVRVVDLFSVKPIDKEGLIKNATECDNLVLTVEDHYPEGGLGEAAASAFMELGNVKIHRIYVDRLPRSGKPEENLEMFSLSSTKIAERIKSILKC